jgi:DNA-binding NtrC family response regulator
MARILVVDDDLAIREMLHAMLERAGHSVRIATNGREAIAEYQENPVDLIISDIVMPDGDGIEMLMELRRLAPDARIVVMSGGGARFKATDHFAAAKHLGALETITKPFERDRILEIVERHT